MDPEIEIADVISQEAEAVTSEQSNEPTNMHDALFGDDAVPSEIDDDEPQKPAVETTDGEVVKPEVKADAETKPEEADEVDLTPPDGLSQKASERFQRLANENKSYREFGKPEELQVMREEAQTLHVFRERIMDCQMQPDELDKAFEYTKAVKTGNWDSAEKFLQEAAYQFAVLTGRKLNVDPLNAYPDLKESVDGMSLDEAHANEIAKNRYLENIQAQKQAAHASELQQQQQQAAQFEAVRGQAINQLPSLTRQWSTSDVLWAEREQQIASFISTELSGKSPSVWVDAVSAYYKALQTVPAQSRQRAPNSLRPNAMGSNNGGKAAQSLADALWGDD